MTYEENSAWFHNVEIGTCLIYPTENRADTEGPDGRVEGVDLNVLSETLSYVLQGHINSRVRSQRGNPYFYLGRGVIEFTKVGGFRSCSIGEMSPVSEIPGSGLSAVGVSSIKRNLLERHTHQSDVFIDRLYPSIRSSRYKQFGVDEFFHGEDYPVLYA